MPGCPSKSRCRIVNPKAASNGESQNLPPGTDELSFNLMVAACYYYETQASLPICVDPDPYGVVIAKACIPHAIAAGSQGAPLAITSVQQESLPGKAIFKMTISNSGNGQAYLKDAITHCLDLKYSDIDRIDYSDIKIGTSNLPTTCSPPSPLILVNGKATLTCIFNIAQNQAFTSTLNLMLNYGYMNTIQKSVKFKKI